MKIEKHIERENYIWEKVCLARKQMWLNLCIFLIGLNSSEKYKSDDIDLDYKLKLPPSKNPWVLDFQAQPSRVIDFQTQPRQQILRVNYDFYWFWVWNSLQQHLVTVYC